MAWCCTFPHPRRLPVSMFLSCRATVARWESWSPWEKFRRATFIPARIIASRIAGEEDAVVTTLVEAPDRFGGCHDRYAAGPRLEDLHAEPTPASS